MKNLRQIKKAIYRLKFYFLIRVTWKNLDFAARRRLVFMTRHTKIDPRKITFTRTFNDNIPGNGFDFIGFEPFFFSKDTFLSIQYNEVD